MNKNYCSEDNSKAPFSMKYMVCPNEVSCGDSGSKFITPRSNGEIFTREIEKYNEDYGFLYDDV